MIDIYEKLGNYGMDISKYVITGVVITTFFRSFDDDEYIIYLAGLSVSVAFMLLSFWAYSKHNDKEQSQKAEKLMINNKVKQKTGGNDYDELCKFAGFRGLSGRFCVACNLYYSN